MNRIKTNNHFSVYINDKQLTIINDDNGKKYLFSLPYEVVGMQLSDNGVMLIMTKAIHFYEFNAISGIIIESGDYINSIFVGECNTKFYVGINYVTDIAVLYELMDNNELNQVFALKNGIIGSLQVMNDIVLLFDKKSNSLYVANEDRCFEEVDVKFIKIMELLTTNSTFVILAFDLLNDTYTWFESENGYTWNRID